MKKRFVLDTNVLIHDPRAIYCFQDNDVVIPIVGSKSSTGSRKASTKWAGTPARSRASSTSCGSGASCRRAVAIDGGGSVRVELNHQSPRQLPPELLSSKADNRILTTALNLSTAEDGLPTVHAGLQTSPIKIPASIQPNKVKVSMKNFTTQILAGLVIVLAAALVGLLAYLMSQPVEQRALLPLVEVAPRLNQIPPNGASIIRTSMIPSRKQKPTMWIQPTAVRRSFHGWNATRAR